MRADFDACANSISFCLNLFLAQLSESVRNKIVPNKSDRDLLCISLRWSRGICHKTKKQKVSSWLTFSTLWYLVCICGTLYYLVYICGSLYYLVYTWYLIAGHVPQDCWRIFFVHLFSHNWHDLDGYSGQTSAPWLSQGIWQFHQTQFVHHAAPTWST